MSLAVQKDAFSFCYLLNLDDQRPTNQLYTVINICFRPSVVKRKELFSFFCELNEKQLTDFRNDKPPSLLSPSPSLHGK